VYTKGKDWHSKGGKLKAVFDGLKGSSGSISLLERGKTAWT